MPDETYAGYQLQVRRPAAATDVEHWSAVGAAGSAEVYIGALDLVPRASSLPCWGPFPEVITGQRDGRGFVVVRGGIDRDVEDLREQLPPGACVAFAWHLSVALSAVHEQGVAHGALHPSYLGIAQSRLTVRPALALTLPAEPDADADARATDCLHLASVLDALELERLDDPGIPLLLSGMRRERARLRLQPARAVRQALRAILARHPDWIAALVETLGPEWSLDSGLRPPLSPLVADRGSARSGSPGASAARLSLAGSTGPATARMAPARISVSPARPLAATQAPAVAAAAVIDAPRSVPPDSPPPTPVPEPAPQLAPDPPERLQVTMLPPEPAAEPVADDDLASSDEEGLQVAAAEDESEEPPVVVMRMGSPPVDAAAAPDEEAPPLPAVMEPEPAGHDGDTDLATEAPDAPPPDLPTDLHLTPAQSAVLDPGPPDDDELPFEVDDEATMVGPGEVDPAERPHALGPPPELRSRPVVTAVLEPEASEVDDEPAPSPALAPPLAAPAPPPAPIPAPAPPPAPVPVEVHGDEPRWKGAGGVTGDDSRADELGSGKWQEDARSLDDVRKVMDDAPVREMEAIDDSGGGAAWPALAAAALIVFLLVLGWVLFGGSPA